ncbi:MAG: adenylate/guanylate cyclase domain-containing protein [Treponema sp.]|nr:adenylate/guanylate cyclase domain-containing protein [Spirochaetia bacterium]MDY4675467.1 adenylate/guanylate cyclase domain-containing protein [Treponema sp.]
MGRKNTRVKNHAIRVAVIVAVTVAVVLVLEGLSLFQRPENMWYDSRMVRTASSHGPSDEIAVVLLDQDSLDWAQQELGWSWPWPRSAYGDIVSYFNLGGAASLAFDVLFTEPSVYGPQDDAAFVQACAEYGRVVQTVYFEASQGRDSLWKEAFPQPPLQNDLAQASAISSDEDLLFPIDSIATSAAVLGNITGSSDWDKVIRRAKAYRPYQSYLVPTLGVAPLFAAGEDGPDPELEPKNGRLLRFQPSLDSYVPYSAGQILQSYYAIQAGQEPLLESDMFQDMYVFFGFYAPGLFDICTTPMSAVYPGVGVHITQLDNYLQDSFLSPTTFPVEVALVVVLAFLGAVPLSLAEIFRLHKLNVLVSVAWMAIFGLLFVVLSYGVFAAGFVLPMMPPLVALLLAFFSAMVVSYRQEGRQRRYLKSAFRHYLSPAVIDTLIAHPESLVLGGERRHISIFFSDVQGFTSISERLSPEELTSLLNDYLSQMTDILLESGGTIDKYEGDAIIAFWNAPVELHDHGRRAVEAMIRCQEKLAQLRPQLEQRAGRPFYMRVGINTGDAVVGNMGSSSRFDYTMLGDSVNLAARLEGLNKQFGTYSMCSAASKEEALAFGTELRFRELARVAVVGKKEAVTVFEPMNANEYAERQAVLDAFSQGLQLFYQGKFPEALEAFSAIQKEDAPAAHYVAKCRELLENPPDLSSWEGVWVATSK